jgi:hypothetical protein
MDIKYRGSMCVKFSDIQSDTSQDGSVVRIPSEKRRKIQRLKLEK